jgi:hypothetical protein
MFCLSVYQIISTCMVYFVFFTCVSSNFFYWNLKESYGEESSSSTDDEEWSGKEKLEDSETDGSVRSTKQSSRRASAGHPINQHTPQSEHHYSEQQTEVLRSNGSNSASRRFGPIIKQV